MNTIQETDRDPGVENEKHTSEHLTERIKKLEEQSKEMQLRIQRMEYKDSATDSAVHGASSKGEHDDEGSFGWCRWRRIMVDSSGPRTGLETAPESVSEFAMVGGRRKRRKQCDESHSTCNQGGDHDEKW